MCRENIVFQLGSKVGIDSGGLTNSDCDESNPPVSEVCKGGWQYHDNGWKTDDDTIKVKCQGRK